ncbi:MAG TPA: FAD-dependent oxidoreductase [Acidimicrobiales bacterium]|nr:FAD-dependent oxidoreductase [Acidimicrobiales bacterium]
MRALIIGGVAGGMSAAARLRRLLDDAEIVVLERSGHVSYANCGLPYYVGGVIEDHDDLLLQTPDALYQRFRLDVRVRHEALALDTGRKRVRVRDLDHESTYEIDYDVLVLSPGAQAVVPPIPGVERALALRTVEDVERLRDAALDARTAVVVGGGFVGLEVVENLHRRGVATTLVEATEQLLGPLDPEMAEPVLAELVRHGVEVHLATGVESIDSATVTLTSGERLDADLVVVAIGVRPEVHLARAAGLALGPRGGVAVDEYQRTSDPAVYAVGDAAEKSDALDGSATLVPLANIANRQGRVAADHIAGRPVRPTPAIGTAIVKVFDLTVALTGWSEKRLRAAGRAAQAIHTHPSSHAGYYPGAEGMALKLIVDPTSGAILGAQGVGRDGVDKRIDVIATALRAGLRAEELSDLELAYAPPFSSAKDPVNMLGYVAENVLSGLGSTAQWDEVARLQSEGALLVDVRTTREFARGHIPGSMNIPVDELRDRAGEIDEAEVLVVCQVGVRGWTAVRLLRALGVDARNLDGGFETWSRSPAARSLEFA